MDRNFVKNSRVELWSSGHLDLVIYGKKDFRISHLLTTTRPARPFGTDVKGFYIGRTNGCLNAGSVRAYRLRT